MSKTSRRSLLIGSSGLFVVAAAPASGSRAAASLQGLCLATASAAFIAYEKARQAHVDFCDGPNSPRSFPTVECMKANEREGDRLGDVRYNACLVIQSRAVTCWQEFIELAAVVQGELWDQTPDGEWDKHSVNEDLEEALQRATWAYIEGGLNG